MPSRLRLGVHRRDEGVQAARVVTAQRIRGPVLRGHQRQVQHLAARQPRADRQARTAALFGVDVVLRDRRAPRPSAGSACGDHHRRHQLGDRGDRQHGVGVLAEQHLVGVLVDDQGHAGLQVERIVGAVQAGQLAERRPRRHRRRSAPCATWPCARDLARALAAACTLAELTLRSRLRPPGGMRQATAASAQQLKARQVQLPARHLPLQLVSGQCRRRETCCKIKNLRDVSQAEGTARSDMGRAALFALLRAQLSPVPPRGRCLLCSLFRADR